MAVWLTVIGIGDSGLASLTEEQRQIIETAECIIGGARHLAMLGDGLSAEMLRWASPFDASRPLLEARRGRQMVVLATGDPTWFGPLVWLRGFIDADEMRVLPAPSSFSLAAARLGWALEGVTCLSVHGRPLAELSRHLASGRKLLVLSANGQSPAEIAGLLTAQGFGASMLTVCEHLGGARQRLRATPAGEFALVDIADLNLVAIECRGGRSFGLFGVPDDAFLHDGNFTKRPMRLLALAALAVRPGAVLWDIGAGCGSISVEWARLGGKALAIEPRADRCAMLTENAARLAGSPIEIVQGAAPEALAGLTPPDAVFIGGGLTPESFAAAFAALRPGAQLVAHAVTLESENLLNTLYRHYGGSLQRIHIETAAPLGGRTGWRPQMPVTHWHVQKGEAAA